MRIKISSSIILIIFLYLAGHQLISRPILELANVSTGKDQVTLISAVAALPRGEAVVYFSGIYITYKPGGIINGTVQWLDIINYVHWVDKINQEGRDAQELCRLAARNSKETGTGLLVLGDMLYITQKDNGTLIKLHLLRNDVLEVDNIPDVKEVVNFGSLFFDPAQIPDKDLLLLADRAKHEIFTYKFSTKHKEVRIRNLYHPKSVSYIFDNNSTYYLVCDLQQVSLYNITWGLVRIIGKAGSGDGELNDPTSAIGLPDCSIVIADGGNNRLSQFTVQGKFVRHLLLESDGITKPSALSFFYPHLWVINDSKNLQRFRLFEN